MKFLAFFNATRDFHTTPKPFFFRCALNGIECFFLLLSFTNTFFPFISSFILSFWLVYTKLLRASIILPFEEFMSFPQNKTSTISLSLFLNMNRRCQHSITLRLSSRLCCISFIDCSYSMPLRNVNTFSSFYLKILANMNV